MLMICVPNSLLCCHGLLRYFPPTDEPRVLFFGVFPTAVFTMGRGGIFFFAPDGVKDEPVLKCFWYPFYWLVVVLFLPLLLPLCYVGDPAYVGHGNEKEEKNEEGWGQWWKAHGDKIDSHFNASIDYVMTRHLRRWLYKGIKILKGHVDATFLRECKESLHNEGKELHTELRLLQLQEHSSRENDGEAHQAICDLDALLGIRVEVVRDGETRGGAILKYEREDQKDSACCPNTIIRRSYTVLFDDDDKQTYTVIEKTVAGLDYSEWIRWSWVNIVWSFKLVGLVCAFMGSIAIYFLQDLVKLCITTYLLVESLFFDIETFDEMLDKISALVEDAVQLLTPPEVKFISKFCSKVFTWSQWLLDKVSSGNKACDCCCFIWPVKYS